MVDAFIQNLRFDERGLVPAVVQDASTHEVLALYYLNNAELAAVLQTGQASFSTPALGNRSKRLADVRINPDGSSLTVLVQGDDALRDESPQPESHSIFVPQARPGSAEVSLVDVASMEFGLAINNLYELIAERKEQRPEGSYTTYLFNSGLDKILKKIAEESGEVIIAAKNKAPREIISELADLFYHLLVLMVERDVKLTEVREELSQRAKPQIKH